MEQVTCRRCGQLIEKRGETWATAEWPKGLFTCGGMIKRPHEPAAPTAPHYESKGAAKEDAEAFNAPVGQPKQVGCERNDGTLNVHPENETCEVCAAPAANALPETAIIESELDEKLMRDTLLKCYSTKVTGFHISTEHYRYLVEQIVSLRQHSKRQLAVAQREIARLNKLINTPQTEDFIEAVKIEAAHQQERWGTEHDGGKTDADWFWLIGYLAGKILRPGITQEKRLHHIVTGASVFLNWHRYATGELTAMRPGIEPPDAQAELLGGKK